MAVTNEAVLTERVLAAGARIELLPVRCAVGHLLRTMQSERCCAGHAARAKLRAASSSLQRTHQAKAPRARGGTAVTLASRSLARDRAKAIAQLRLQVKMSVGERVNRCTCKAKFYFPPAEGPAPCSGKSTEGNLETAPLPR